MQFDWWIIEVWEDWFNFAIVLFIGWSMKAILWVSDNYTTVAFIGWPTRAIPCISNENFTQRFNVHSNAFNGHPNASNGHWAFSTAIYNCLNAVQGVDKLRNQTSKLEPFFLKSPSYYRKSPLNKQFSEELDVILTFLPQNLFLAITFSGFFWKSLKC